MPLLFLPEVLWVLSEREGNTGSLNHPGPDWDDRGGFYWLTQHPILPKALLDPAGTTSKATQDSQAQTGKVCELWRDCQHIGRGPELGEEIGGRGNPWRSEHPLFRKTESLPGQLLRSHHKLKSRPPAWSVPFLTRLPGQGANWLGRCPRGETLPGTGAPPAFPPRRSQRLRAPPGPPALRGSAWAAAPKNSRLCRASRSSRPSPAVPASLLKQRRREGKSSKSCQQEGKSGFGSPAAPVGGCSGGLMLSRDGGMWARLRIRSGNNPWRSGCGDLYRVWVGARQRTGSSCAAGQTGEPRSPASEIVRQLGRSATTPLCFRIARRSSASLCRWKFASRGAAPEKFTLFLGTLCGSPF